MTTFISSIINTGGPLLVSEPGKTCCGSLFLVLVPMSSGGRTGGVVSVKCVVILPSPSTFVTSYMYSGCFVGTFTSNVYLVVVLLPVNKGNTQVLLPSLFKTSYHTASSQGRAHTANSNGPLLMSHF